MSSTFPREEKEEEILSSFRLEGSPLWMVNLILLLDSWWTSEESSAFNMETMLSLERIDIMIRFSVIVEDVL